MLNKKGSLVCLLLSLIILAGCGMNSDEYRLKLIDNSQEAKLMCSSHGQIYLLTTTKDIKTYNAVCYQESPLRFFEYEI